MKNQYTIEEEYFENLTQLVEYYKHDSDGLVTKLKEPVAKVGKFLLIERLLLKVIIHANVMKLLGDITVCQISTIYYHLQLDGVYQKVILNLDLRLAKESLEVHTYACVCISL